MFLKFVLFSCGLITSVRKVTKLQTRQPGNRCLISAIHHKYLFSATFQTGLVPAYLPLHLVQGKNGSHTTAVQKVSDQIARKNTFTRLEVFNSNLLRSSLLVTEHTSPSGSAIVRNISGMPLYEGSTAWPLYSV
jgi:hypothetical protein